MRTTGCATAARAFPRAVTASSSRPAPGSFTNTDNAGTLTITSITFTGTGYTISSNSGTINLGTGGLSVSSTAGASTDAFNVGMVFLDPETFNVAISGQVFTDSLTMSLATFL